jgi:hypothetical protein
MPDSATKTIYFSKSFVLGIVLLVLIFAIGLFLYIYFRVALTRESISGDDYF